MKKGNRNREGFFGLLKIGNLIQMVFETYASGILFCSSRRVEQKGETKI
jgi:hypothetical protein